jgi:NAD(P)-dependent dehydrogenase (short-subunit alcohol dehydrogenase family)
MQDKIILITGASRGLGLALAQHWQAKNVVIGLARTRPAQLGPDAAFYLCDLANEDETAHTMKAITRDFPKIDMLINNAAVLKTLPLGVMREKDISRMIDINLKAPILISKAVFRRMIGARSGQIINILSMAPKLCVEGDSIYSATKAGLEAFARVLNKEGHPFGVHVNNIGLSAFSSGMLDQIIGEHPERILSLIPHKQFAPFKEVLASIEFFQANSTDIGGQTLYFGGVA